MLAETFMTVCKSFMSMVDYLKPNNTDKNTYVFLDTQHF